MIDASNFSIREHTEVVGSDGQHVGTVDHVQGDQIKLAKKDPAAGGVHRFVPIASVASASEQRVTLKQPAAEVMARW